MFDKKKILVLSPHPDDVELAMGATVAKLIGAGVDIVWTTFSWCEESLGKGDDIKKELNNSIKKLGVRSSNLINYDFRVRRFPEFRQEILEGLIKLRKDFVPELVFTPCSSDIHQDHKTISEETHRAFKHCSILGYEEPWNDFETSANFFVQVEEAHIQKKIEAVGEYKSQKDKRNYVTAEYLKSLAIVKGQMINERYAEAFEVIRWVVR